MKKEHAIFAAVFCSLLVLVMGSVLVCAADSHGEYVSPVLLWISKQLVALFTYPFVVISKLLNAPVRSAIIIYLLDIALYAYLITLGITKWLNKRPFSSY